MTDPSVAALVAPLAADPSGSALLFDFDGTLAPVVDVPDAARPAPGVVERLELLARRYRTVAVVSGRPVDFLAAQLPAGVALSGLYGLEWSLDGTRWHRPGVDAWRAAIDEAAAGATDAGLDGLLVEAKGLSVTLHYRSRPEAAGAVEELSAVLVADTGLVARPAKMSVELHPPVDADKGMVVGELAEGATGVLYVGDDLGDLPAFAALGVLRGEGLVTLAVAVDSPELPAAVRAAAELVVDGPDGVLSLLDDLADGLLDDVADAPSGPPVPPP